MDAQTTYGSILRTYAAGLDEGTNDRDASADTRYWAARFLRIVSHTSTATGRLSAGDAAVTDCAYPPTTADRDAAVAALYDYLTRSYGPGDDGHAAFDAGFELARTILRNV